MAPLRLQRFTRAPRALRTRVPVLLVFGSLLWLALLPFLVQRKTAAQLNEITHLIEPARKAISDMQVAFALEAVGTTGYLLTGWETYSISHRKARGARDAAHARLSEVAGAISPDIETTVRTIERELQPADALLTTLHGGRMTREDYQRYLPAQQVRFEAVTATTARLHDAIRNEAALRRDRVRSIQATGGWLTIIGVFLAMGALLSVARLGARYRSAAQREQLARGEAERRHEQIERLSASRERLIRGFSHDLKNPLGAADGYLAMLQRGVAAPLTPTQHDWIASARRSVTAGLALVADLLELSRAERGDIDLQLQPMDLADVTARAVADYRAQAAAKGLAIVAEADPGVPPVRSDPARVAQILGNLLTNAVKYADSGTIRVRAGMRRNAAGQQRAVIDVYDTGAGISGEALEHVFEEFYRSESGGAADGAGIGLAISQRLANLLAGEITVVSEPGRGSQFTLWLPLESAAAAALT